MRDKWNLFLCSIGYHKLIKRPVSPTHTFMTCERCPLERVFDQETRTVHLMAEYDGEKR